VCPHSLRQDLTFVVTVFQQWEGRCSCCWRMVQSNEEFLSNMTPQEDSIRIMDVTQYGPARPSILCDSNRIFKTTTPFHPVTVFSHLANEHPEINNTLEWRKTIQEGRQYSTFVTKAVNITGVSVNRRSGRLLWTQ